MNIYDRAHQDDASHTSLLAIYIGIFKKFKQPLGRGGVNIVSGVHKTHFSFCVPRVNNKRY